MLGQARASRRASGLGLGVSAVLNHKPGSGVSGLGFRALGFRV